MGSPDPPPPYRLVLAYPDVKFKEPVFIAQEPGAERLWIGEYGGRIYSFDPRDPAASKHLVLDIERGLSAFSFHPKFLDNRQIFVFSHLDRKVKRQGQMTQIYRYRVEAGGGTPRGVPQSRETIIEWPAGGHNGGEAIIGPDGYLYITTGDGTSGSDKNETGQGVDDLLAVMMRIDVEHADPGRKYSIPKDNPFVNMKGARGEIWSYGFRNPWRFSFDPVTGRPWVGDVGQDIWEMIELTDKGANHGWSVMEGSHPFHINARRGPTPIVPPVVEHHHTICRSITGGYVYQGDKFPELRGAYVYGDYEYGKMWAFRYDAARKKVLWHKELTDSAVKISSFGMGRDGSFYALDNSTGEIYQLDRRPPAEKRPPFPRKLSETGLFVSVKDHTVSPGVIRYEINAPFWSDGAHKERFFALPGEAKLEAKEKGAWEFDDGAVTVKSFQLDMEEGNPASRRRIETRIVVKQENHWVGYTYAWNHAQTDAELVGAAGMDRTYTIQDAKARGGKRKQVWHYPSRNECMFCHSRAAGFVLGLNTHQMNRGDQLQKLSAAELLRKPLERTAAEMPAYPNPFDASVPVEARVKTYLEVNCAMCHVSDGGGNSPMELGYDTPIAKANIVGERPTHDTLGINGGLLVAPGDPARSLLLERIRRRGTHQMPPTSTNRVDARGAALLAEWIRSLKP
jgi:uncharacterized repeat protein (TIGR03806 family)